MVARDRPTQAAGRDRLVSRLFHTWRVALTNVRDALGKTLRHVAPDASWRTALVRGIVGLDVTQRGAGSARQLVVTAGALAFGASIVGIALAAPAGLARALANAMVGLMWLGARYVIMRLIGAPRDSAESRIIAGAWASGALPAALAVTWPLRTVGWALGAFLTYRSLRSAGVETRRSRRITTWAFAAEALGYAGVLLTRNLAVLMRYLGT